MKYALPIAAALLAAAVLCQPSLAYAAPHGGGGFRGGGFGGFHAGRFHDGGLGGFRGGGFHGTFAGLHHRLGHPTGYWDHGWHNGRYGWWWGGDGLGWTYYADPSWGYPNYGNYDYNQPYASQTCTIAPILQAIPRM